MVSDEREVSIYKIIQSSLTYHPALLYLPTIVHYQFLGSYTASGDGDGEDEGNLANIRLAHKHDMGVFIISPYDKGGKVYAPSHLCRELMLPEMEPMEYGEFVLELAAHLIDVLCECWY